MKYFFKINFLTGLIVTIFISCSKADFNDASKRNENWAYWVDKDSGKASWIPITDETTVENGVYHLFYSNGKLFEKGKLKNKVHVDTVYRYNELGEVIKYHIHQKDTVLYVYLKDGDYLEKFHNGTIYEEGKLTNGIFNDNWTRYYESGQPEFIQEYENGTGKITWFYESGNVSSKVYRVNRKPHGEVNHWYENGNLKEVSHWVNGLQNGLYTIYYENGTLKNEAEWKNGKSHGKNEEWYENGNRSSLNFFENDIIVGSLKNWNEKGQLIAEENYVNGNLDGKSIRYHDNGVVSISGYYKENKPFGTCEFFDEKGKLIKKRYFENGNLIKEEKI